MSDLDFYDEPEPLDGMLATAGVATGYVVIRDADGEVEEVLSGALISSGDGKFYWQPSDG